MIKWRHILSLVLVFFVLVLLFFQGKCSESKEKYYLRDVPYGLGFGGWPPGLYSKRFPYNFYLWKYGGYAPYFWW